LGGRDRSTVVQGSWVKAGDLKNKLKKKEKMERDGNVVEHFPSKWGAPNTKLSQYHNFKKERFRFSPKCRILNYIY
jgi:hypothetical protein